MPETIDLAAVVIKLKANEPGQMPATNGRIVHGAFINWIDRLSDGLLIEPFHRANTLRQFTLSQIRGGDQRCDNGYFRIRKDDNFWIRQTCLYRESSEVILPLTECTDFDPIEMNGISFHVKTIELNHKRAGCTSYRALKEQCFDAEPLPWFRFHYHSATYFRNNSDHGREMSIIEPTPSLIFSHLAKRWDHFAGDPDLMIPGSREALISSLERSITPCKIYDVRSWPLYFGPDVKHKKGFTGVWEYQSTKAAAPDLMRWIRLLGCYSFYAGIGSDTQWGMGQVSFIQP